MTSRPDTALVRHHSLLPLIGLHLVPGVLTTLLSVVLAPLVMTAGFPAVYTVCRRARRHSL